MADDHDDATYVAVVNDEEQYSVWPAELPLPAGWHGVGVSGPRQHCLDYIEKTWTDMRPLSLQQAMAADQ
jgi:MbtH protein